jgi:hypothetical protein
MTDLSRVRAQRRTYTDDLNGAALRTLNAARNAYRFAANAFTFETLTAAESVLALIQASKAQETWRSARRHADGQSRAREKEPTDANYAASTTTTEAGSREGSSAG